MPGIDNGVGNVAAAVPYSWEAAPGKPMVGVVTDLTESPRAPLPLPPGSRGVRRPATFVEPTFGGFAPAVDVAKSSGTHIAEKLFKKLHTKLKKKSKLLAASFASESTAELKKRVSDTEESVQSVQSVQSISYDSDEHLQTWSSSSTFDQPDTPLSTDSGSLSSMSSLSSTSTSWESIGYPSTLHQEDSQRSIDLLLAASSSDDNYDGNLSGPRESAWHEESEGEDDELTEQEWQIVRYASLQRNGSNLISTLVRQSSLTPLGDHSYQFSPIRGRKLE